MCLILFLFVFITFLFGSINFFVYVRDDVINLDYYTNIYAQVLGAKNEIANTDKYWELVNPAISNIENIKQSREEERYNQLINEATSKLDDAQKEFEKKKAEVEAELNDAENKNYSPFANKVYFISLKFI